MDKVIENHLDTLVRVCHSISHRNSEAVNENNALSPEEKQGEALTRCLFKLTGDDNVSPKIAELAESFGLMLVKIEARELRQEKLINELRQTNKALEASTRSLQLTQDVTIESLGNLAEYRDQETGGHIKRTKRYVQCLAEAVMERGLYPQSGLNPAMVELLVKSAPLHDIGKVGVPDAILMKPGKLSQEEFYEMKKHTVYGRDIIAASERSLGSESFLSLAREIACSHHEKWNGKGYPEGKKAEEIPLSGRIMAIADVYDALISKRVYKSPFSHEQAVAIIVEESGISFDPRLVELFIELAERFREIAIEFADHEEERQALG